MRILFFSKRLAAETSGFERLRTAWVYEIAVVWLLLPSRAKIRSSSIWNLSTKDDSVDAITPSLVEISPISEQSSLILSSSLRSSERSCLYVVIFLGVELSFDRTDQRLSKLSLQLDSVEIVGLMSSYTVIASRSREDEGGGVRCIRYESLPAIKLLSSGN